MGDVAIRVNSLGKRYHIGALQTRQDTLRDALMAQARRLGRRRHDSDDPEHFWALKDVSFEVKRGDVVGVIGRNGAGKSTLLKILSRITEPTEGSIELHGRVGSLLEVGTGFHPELSGRENIYLNGAILGMKRAEIERRFDEIVAFSEIERFLDTPVKHYSSGMYVRLAFAVAAHLETEILLVDEVLAVGDASFQKKCMGKMGDVAREGRTVFLVSHNMGAVGRLCETVLCLESGRVGFHGEVEEGSSWYNRLLASAMGGEDRDDRVQEGQAKFRRWELVHASTGMKHACYEREHSTFQFSLLVRSAVRKARLGFEIVNMDGLRLILAHNGDDGGSEVDFEPGEYHILWKVPIALREGEYSPRVWIISALEQVTIDEWVARPVLTVLPKHHQLAEVAYQGILSVAVKMEVTPVLEGNLVA